MAKTRLELLTEVGNAVQPKLRYTQSEALPGQELGKYDQGITMFDSPETRKELNYQNQTGWQAWGNALGQSLAEVTAGTLEGFGYLLDLEQHVKALAGTEKEFDNEFSKTMRQYKDSVREEMPVFTDPNKPFDPLNSRWWASNLPSIVSTLTLMIPTGAAVGAIGKLGKVGRALTSEAKLLGGLTSARAITSGAISRVLESTMEAAGNADQVYKQLIQEGKSEEEARTEAGKVASNTYYANLPLMLSDMFEYSVLFRSKGVDQAVDALNKQTKKSLLKNSLAVGGSFLSEGFEEGYQYGVGEEAKKSKNAGETMGNVVSNFGEYFDDPEFLSSVVVGGMSGAGFQALGNVIESRSAKLANVFPEFNGEALNALAASTGQSISNLKVLGQAAFKKFKGNLKEALANTEEAVKSLPEGQREIFKLGLETLKQAGNFVDGKLQQLEPEKASDAMWNGAKEKLNQGISKLKKWVGINEKIQQAEAIGNKVEVELLTREQYQELIKESPDRAEQFIQQAKEDKVVDPRLVQDYEELLNTYKKSIVQSQGNQDVADAEGKAEIRRQTIAQLQEEAFTEGAKYRDFDYNQIREQYLDNIGTPEAKSLKSNIEIDKKANKSVRKPLKNLIEHLTQLEIEEIKYSKDADKLGTSKGQEELAAKKKEDKIAEIKKSNDPEVLFEAYQGEDEDISKLAKSRIDKLIKEEFDVLPDPNIFDNVDDFKEFITADTFPVLGLTKVAPAINAALSDFYYTNRVEDKPTEETFEDPDFEKVGKNLIQESEVDEGEPELDSELGDYKTLNEEIQENLEESGDFMLHSQLWSMSRDKSGDWNLRQFNKVTQKDIDEGKFPQDQLGNNKYNSTSYNDWTDDEIATEELFNNFGDYRQYEVFFETQPKSWTDFKTNKRVTTDINNHWIRLFVVKDGKKIYIGQLQSTAKTADKERTNTKALAELRQVADEALKTLKPGESKVIGSTRIVNYNPGLYNNLAKPRDVKAALTDEELDNLGIGVYMGRHEDMGLMKTNRPDIRTIKPVNAKPGSVYVAKRTPAGDLQWFACITKNLREMPELVDKVRKLLAPFESTDPLELQLATREEKVRTTLNQLREIVRYRVNEKLEPDFNSKIVNVKAYHDENGKFSADIFIDKHKLLDRKVQIDPKRLEEEGYAESILDRLITDIDRIPFVNPFITVAPPDTKVLDRTSENKSGIAPFNDSLFRGQEDRPTIQPDGSLRLIPTYDTLFKSEGISFAKSLGMAEGYGARYSKAPYIVVIDREYMEKLYPFKKDGKSNDYGSRVTGDEGEERVIAELPFNIPKEHYKVYKTNLDYNLDSVSTLALLDKLVYFADEGNVAEALRYGESSQGFATEDDSLEFLIRQELQRRSVSDQEINIYLTNSKTDWESYAEIVFGTNEFSDEDLKYLDDQIAKIKEKYLDYELDKIDPDSLLGKRKVEIKPTSQSYQLISPVIEKQPKVKLKTSTTKKKFLRTDQKPELYQGQIDVEKAVRELKRIVPNGYTVNVLKGLIESEGISAYGMVHDAAITLSEKAPFGTEYHEAWHAIEQVLPKFQYDRIKNYLTEEERADLYAEYEMTNQAPSLLKRIFQLVKAFLQDLINYHPTLLDLFDRANAGYYKNKKIGRYGTFYKIDGLTERNKADLVNVYLAEVGEFYDLSKKENVETLIDSNPQQNGLTFIGDESPLVSFISKVAEVKGLDEANKLLAYIRPDARVTEEGEIELKGEPRFGELYPELLKSLGKRGYKIVLGRTELDITIGQERELEDGEAFEDAETNTLEGWQESASLRSPIEKLSKRMKQLIYSIKSDKTDSLGLGMNLTYNGYEAYSRLASVIVDSIDVDDMYKKIGTRKDRFFEALNDYIYNKFDNHQAIWTELYKALGDKTQPQFWVTQEYIDPKIQVPGQEPVVSIRVFEANRANIKAQVKNVLGDYTGEDAKAFLTLLGMEDVYVRYVVLSTALKVKDKKDRFLAVWKILGSKMYSKFIASHLNVEGKKQYEIINGGFFSKLTQRLQRDFEGIKTELFNKDPFLRELPILTDKPKADDFQFVIYAGYKDVDGKGLMYNNYTEKEFVTSTFRAWMGKEKIHMMPILSDSPNLIGVRYRIPEGDREEMIAKIIHLERKRSKDTYGIKNYNPEVNIFEEIPYRENLNEQILEVQKYFDNAEKEYIEYANRVGANIQLKSKDNPNLVRSYLLEHAIVHSQMSILSVGHLSFYKNLEDYYKRAKEIWSPVIKGNVDNYFMDGDTKIEVFSKKQRVNVLPTVESPSSQVEELESIGFNDYRKVDKTDAQSEIDLISYRDRMITLNEWTPKHQEAFVKLAKGEMIEEVGLFNVLKPFYFNMHVVDGNLVSPVQKKDSELLILPIYGLEKINGQDNILYNPLWKKHLEMMGYNFDTMSYDEQGRKEGKYYDVHSYDTTIKTGKRDELVIDLANWGKQQETPEHHYMSDAIFGTQIMKLITGNLEGNYNVDGASMSAKALWKEYNELIVAWTAEQFDQVINDYGSEAKLKRMIIEEMINKGMRDDYIRSVQQLPLTHPIHFNKVIQIINSFAKNNITDLKFDKGYTMANASSEGFQRELKIKWNNNDPKQGIDYFEVFAPIHDKRVRNYMVRGIVDMDALRADIKAGKIPDLLSGLVYRIPTEGKYSMFKIKIVGFLPVDNGVIFMPDMVTKIAGLDFDIDKVRGFFLGGNQRQDRILKLMMAVLSSPASLKEQLTPGGFDNLKNNNLLIRAYKAGINPEGKSNKELEVLLKDKMPFFSPITLSKIARRMMVGKALIGTAANANAVHSLMEAYSTFDISEYNDGIDITYNGEVLDTLSRKYDTDGNLISANIAELLAAFVDNGKDPQAEYSNITSDTIGTALYLLKKGVPLKAVQFFMTQVTDDLNTPYQGMEQRTTEVELNFEDIENKLKTNEFPYEINKVFRTIRKGATMFEAYVAGVKVANAGAGATMVDNYLKIKKYKKALNINQSVINDPGLTKTLIEKGLTEWNDFIVNTFKVPDVNKGTIVQALNILSDQVLKYVSDDTVKDLYNSFINYVASGYFKYDAKVVEEMTNLDKLMAHKLKHPDNKFLNRLEINKDGYLQFIGANTNDELEIQSIIDDWDNLINSADGNTRTFGEDLIKYSFYQRGFDFGMGSFGHLIPVSYFIKNTEFTKYYVDTMRALDQPNQEKANAFVEQYIANNYIDVQLPTAKGELVEEGILKVDYPPSVDGQNVARYIKFDGVPYKYAGDGTYRLLPVRAKYVGTNKYIQRYDFNAKPKEYNSRPSEKKYVTQSIDVVANTLEKLEVENQVLTNSTDKNVIVPEGSSSNNLPIFTTDDSIFLMNDQQQSAHDKIFKFISEKLDDRSKDQTPLKISKLGTGSIPKGVYDNSIGLLGKGGTGKTSMLKVLIENIKEKKSKGYNRVSVRYIAPTHTAATMLQEALGFDSERTGEGVSTFASFVGRNQLKGSPDGIPENSDLLLVKDDIWLKQIEMGITIPVSSADIVVIDESSMISNTMLQNFMQRFNVEGGSQLPIFIFMGDYRQLPPVEETKEKFSEGVVSATIFANPDKYVELTQVMRSKDKELHRVYDSVGQQITQQRNQILNGQTPDKFDWKKYDDVTNKSTSNILITQERQVDQVIEDYTKQLVKQDNPYHIFWTHYNKLNHQRTQVLFNKIRNTYFQKLGVTDVKPGVMVNDYVQYTQSLPLPTLNGKYGEINVASGELKPGSRYKVKDLRKEAVDVSEISDTLLDYFGGVTMNMDKIYLVNRKDQLRYTMLFEKGAITAGTYNKETKTIPVTIRTSDGVSLTREVAYKDFFSLKSYVASAKKGIDGIFEPSYIGSTHTVQGASIKTIIVGDYNIRQNQGSVDMRDIESSLYTALTRSAGKLVIIKPDVIKIENNQDVFSYNLETPESVVPSQEKVMQPMQFEEEQSSGYRERTIKNASADATIALASDFTTAGERLTKNSVEGQKKKYIPIDTKNLTIAPERVAGIVSRLNSVNAKTLNIAGNGIYSLPYTQEQVDEFTYQLLKAVVESPDLKNKIESIRSGGQTGFDEAGVKAGRRLGIPTLVLAPKGWKFRNKQGQDISNEQQFKARFDVQVPTQMTMFNQPTVVKGEEISSYSDNLAFALTNPVFTSPTGQEWKREWKEGQKKWREYLKDGIVFEGKKWRDTEQAYQKNKERFPVGEARNNFMLELIEIKLRTYPKLVEGIDAKGGVDYLKNSTHQPTKKNSDWETGGKNMFIKLLTQAYMNVKGLGKQEGTQMNMFDTITFTQEMVDKLNEITEGKRKGGFVYTLDYLNNLPEETKQKAIYCYTTGIIPGKS